MARGRQEYATLDALVGEDLTDRTGYLGFPPYHQPHFEAPYIVEVHLPTKEDVEKFNELLDLDVPESMLKISVKSIWYPELENGERGHNSRYVWVEEE